VSTTSIHEVADVPPAGPRSDTELVRALSAGEPGAFDELYRRHSPAAAEVARRVSRNPEDVDDAVAEAFARVLTMLSRRPPRDIAFRSYLLTTTRHVAIDLARARARTVTVPDVDYAGPACGPGPSEGVVAGENRAMMGAAFGDLPERWQTVLWLTEVERYRPRQVGEALGLTPDNVRQLAFRARARLRARYLQAHVGNGVRPACRYAVERLGAHMSDILPPGERAVVDEHLAVCDDCRLRSDDLQDLQPALRRAAIPLPVGVAATVARTVGSESLDGYHGRSPFRHRGRMEAVPSSGRSTRPVEDRAVAADAARLGSSDVANALMVRASGLAPGATTAGWSETLRALLEGPVVQWATAAAAAAMTVAGLAALNHVSAPEASVRDVTPVVAPVDPSGASDARSSADGVRADASGAAPGGARSASPAELSADDTPVGVRSPSTPPPSRPAIFDRPSSVGGTGHPVGAGAAPPPSATVAIPSPSAPTIGAARGAPGSSPSTPAAPKAPPAKEGDASRLPPSAPLLDQPAGVPPLPPDAPAPPSVQLPEDVPPPAPPPPAVDPGLDLKSPVSGDGDGLPVPEPPVTVDPEELPPTILDVAPEPAELVGALEELVGDGGGEGDAPAVPALPV
jgi:RNA polymerase sigma factor (sigma-70 family)